MKEIKTLAHAERATDSLSCIPDFPPLHGTKLSASVERHRKSLTWVLCGLLAPLVVFSRSAWPLHDPFHEAIEALGLLLVVSSIAGRVFCTFYIGGRKNHVLTRDGPYSGVRNPLYICSVLGVAGIGFTTGSIQLGVLFGALTFLFLSALVRAEEARLLHRFGDDYRAYLFEVPRWLPDFRRWSDSEGRIVQSALVWRRLRDGLGLLLLVPLMEGVEQAQALGVLPVMLALR